MGDWRESRQEWHIVAMREPREPQMSVAVLNDRIRDQGRETHLTLTGILASVAVANAAYVLALLLASSISPTLWLPFMLASLGFMTVTLVGPSTTSLLLVSMPDWRDGVLPLFQAMAIFLMFSMLMPVRSSLPLLVDWYLCPAAHSLIGAIWMRHFVAKINRSSYEPALTELINMHVNNLRRTSKVAGSAGTLWIAAWAVMRFWAAPYHPAVLQWQGLLGLVALTVSIIMIRYTELYRRVFSDSIPLTASAV